MAKQLNMLSGGQIISTALHTEMQQSYLEYAMSVIVGRALPDARDGLKPVHRRILYAMHELGLTPDRPYRKCARVVGDVLGKYHPHGDQAVYDALVRMVQDFSSRYPLLAGHGNFGSVDDDPPAAMRYTETRLAEVGNSALLTEIGDETVDFVSNFDNSQQEPSVLPAQLPILLLNGSSGIAVGMATNIPPHNLNEVVDGLIALIDNPNLSDEKLLELIPGPDYPTGGEIISQEGIREAYLTGRGSIPARGVVQIEEVQPGRGRHRRAAIVVTELPYQVNKSAWIEKVADLVNQGRLEGIADIRDESDREGIRVVIELKREANLQKILGILYKQTALQTNFGAILLALDNGQPKQMSLRELLQSFITFREETLTRRYQHELNRAEARLHLLEALILALNHLDEIIEILRNAPDGSTAKAEMQAEFEFSDRQADAILAMPLRRLTGMERQNLQTEFDELAERVTELQRLLGDRRELLKALKKDLRALKKKFGDDRRTKILGLHETATQANGEPRLDIEGLDLDSPLLATLDLEVEEEQETVVEITQRGYVRRLTPKAYQRNLNRMVEKQAGVLEEEDDFVTQTMFATTGNMLVVITRTGKAYPVSVADIPVASGRSNAKGTPLVTLLPASTQGDRNLIASAFLLPEDLESFFLLLVTQQGRVKRLSIEEFADLTGRGLTLIKLKEDDQLTHASLVEEGYRIVLASSGGRALHLEIGEHLPVMSRTAQGNVAMRLRRQEQMIGCAIVFPDESFLLISEQGYAKRLPLSSLRLSTPGDLGIQVFVFNNRSDTLAGVVVAIPQQPVMITTTASRMTRIEPDTRPMKGRDDKGDRLLKLNTDERLASITPINLPGDEEEAESEAEE
ncbi:MAG TPA: DNA gyrase subunit A [Leptolyngbyaceae cyanobacterium M33_DOE_097]|uniref:DNA topoisomerase (ATP-hydrolyzing) n=1 Tax=Oscillatoriales cyanobacterium SpSt-418 TaxID=2282169 RepID=A0A7C3KGA9_9CYAN|nr:DNA gyrase subunit A [Leptolyngbyaceae cyanobacterium M33_DOE_097]